MRSRVKSQQLALFLSLCLLGAGCTHFGSTASEEGDREPAGFSYKKSCGKLSKSEIEDFKRLVKADDGLGGEIAFFQDFHHRTGLEKDFNEGKPMDLEFILKDDQVTSLGDKLDYLLKEPLIICNDVRQGTQPRSDFKPKLITWLKKVCGVEDLKRKSKELAHPKNPRTIWTDYSYAPPRYIKEPCNYPKDDPRFKDVSNDGCEKDTLDLRQWVRETNALIDPKTGALIASPGTAADLCKNYSHKESLEDRIENYLLCFEAVFLTRAEYDEKNHQYVTTKEGNLQAKKFSKPLKDCLKAYEAGLVVIDKEGEPIKAVEPPKPKVDPKQGNSDQKNDENKNKPVVPASDDKSESKDGSVRSNKPKEGKENGWGGTVDKQNGDKAVWSPKQGSGGKLRKDCLPGDPSDWDGCKDDCTSDFAATVKYSRIPISKTFSSKTLEELYNKERYTYVTEISKHQIRLLAQGYVIAGTERKWVSPKAYNENIHQLALTTRESQLKTFATEMMKGDLIDTTETDGAYDETFGEFTNLAETLGQRMVATAIQIEYLQKLIQILRWENGAHEINIATAPAFLKYLPVLRHYAGAPIGISFGNIGDYQCNLFTTMTGDVMNGVGFPISSKLIRPADMMIRKAILEDDFRKTAFCTNDPACEMPYEFKNYLNDTDPQKYVEIDKRIASGKEPYRIGTIEWCNTRWQASHSLTAMIMQLVSLYPALGHADKDDDGAPGLPLFARIKSFPGTLEAKAKYAAKEARRVLPLIQADILKYVGRVSDDLDARKMESTYMAFINGATLAGFDYCKERGGLRTELDGVECYLRETYLGCKLKKEAKQWEEEQRVPDFLKQVVMTGLDAAFVWGAASGGIGALFTLRGLVVGGVSGVVFTAVDVGVSRWIARRTTALWDDFHQGVAGAMLESVDSYTNAITSIAEAHPKALLKDYILGFAMGVVFSGKGKGGNKSSGKGGGFEAKGAIKNSAHETPHEVFEKLAEKIAEYAEKSGDGVRFKPENVSQLKTWMMQQAGEHPDFVDNLIKNLGEHLNSLTDVEYADLFSSAEGKTSLARIRRAIGLRIKSLAPKLEKLLGEARDRARAKKIKQGDFKGSLAPEVEVQGTDIIAAAEKLGPREKATLADAMDSIVNEPNPKAKAKLLDEFFKNLCGLAASCGLQVRGCL